MSFSLGSFAGGVVQGLDASAQQQLARQQAAAQKMATQGQDAFGGALGNLYGAPAAPQPSGFGATPIGGMLSGMFGGQQPQAPSGMPQPASPMPAQAPVANSPMMGSAPQPPAPQPPQPGQPQGTAGMAGQPQPQVQPGNDPNAQPQQPQQPRGNLNLPDLVSAIQKARPGIKGGALAAAVSSAIPLMNAQGLAQWRSIQPQLAQERIGIQKGNLDERKDFDKVKQQQGDQRIEIAKQRLDETTRNHTETITLKTQQLQNTKDGKEAARLATDVRAAISAKLRAKQQQINAANSFNEDEKKKLMSDAAAEADEASAQLDNALKAQRQFESQNSSTAQPEKAQPGQPKDTTRATPQATTDAPMQVQTKEEAEGLPKGTVFIFNGETYVR